MALSPSHVVRNRLLAGLPADVLEELRPKLHPMELKLRQNLYEPEGDMDTAYFPEAGMISLITTLEDGMQAEVGIIGQEGMLGVALMAGVDKSFVEAMVQLPGSALRMAAADFRRSIEEHPSLRRLLLRYNDALQAQVMQTAACNGRHGLEQRLARWLLMAHDRAGVDELQLTQEFMAMMLATHRPSVTVSAGILQRAGLIRYVGGRITIVDRPNLEAASCECYEAVRRRFSSVLGTNIS